MATVLTRQVIDEKGSATQSTTSLDQIPPLGVPRQEKRFWWQRTKSFDRNAIATQVRFSPKMSWV